MAKDKEERIRELLNPREAVVFQGRMHKAIYFLPLLFFMLGVVIVFLTIPEVTVQLPERVQALAADWINGAKETHLGLWLMAGSILFAYKFHMEDKHLIQIVTNQRVVQVSGAWTTEQEDLKLNHIDMKHIRIKRGHLINRLLHRGSIYLDHLKNKELNIVMKGVSMPETFVEHLRAVHERYAEALNIRERAEKERSVK